MPDLATALPCRRPELVARPFGESGSYLVRDRLQGESFQIGPEEHFLLARLDGTPTAKDLCAVFAARTMRGYSIGRGIVPRPGGMFQLSRWERPPCPTSPRHSPAGGPS